MSHGEAGKPGCLLGLLGMAWGILFPFSFAYDPEERAVYITLKIGIVQVIWFTLGFVAATAWWLSRSHTFSLQGVFMITCKVFRVEDGQVVFVRGEPQRPRLRLPHLPKWLLLVYHFFF